MSDLAVVIPTYNEEKSIVELIERIENTLDGNGLDYSVYIVDDYSTDNTYAAVENHIKSKANNPPIKVCIVPIKNDIFIPSKSFALLPR